MGGCVSGAWLAFLLGLCAWLFFGEADFYFFSPFWVLLFFGGVWACAVSSEVNDRQFIHNSWILRWFAVVAAED